VWDELHLGKKRVGLGDLPRGKLPKPAHSLLVQWRQRFLATQLREQFAIQEHVVYRGVLVLDAALGLGAPIHLRHYDKDAIYIPRLRLRLTPTLVTESTALHSALTKAQGQHVVGMQVL
jgi:hypothetical protein